MATTPFFEFVVLSSFTTVFFTILIYFLYGLYKEIQGTAATGTGTIGSNPLKQHSSIVLPSIFRSSSHGASHGKKGGGAYTTIPQRHQKSSSSSHAIFFGTNEEMKFSEESDGEVIEEEMEFSNTNVKSISNNLKRQQHEMKSFPGQSQSGRIYLPQGY